MAIEQRNSQIQAVVFDMDGVIVDSHPAHRDAWREFLRTCGRDCSEAELDFVLDGRKRDEILTHFLGPLTNEQLKHYGKAKDDLFWSAASEVKPIPGVLDFLASIRSAGIPVAVATSGSGKRTISILTRLDLMCQFSAVVSGDEVRAGKPDPEIYLLACQRLHCPPATALAFEDAASGVRAAKRAGLKCIAIATNGSEPMLSAAGADCLIGGFADLTFDKVCSLMSKVTSAPPLQTAL